MTLVNITLTEDEQAFLIGLTGEGSTITPYTAFGIASKIREARVLPPEEDAK